MKLIICNRIEVVHVNDVQSIDGENVTLFSLREWIPVKTISPVTYELSTEPTDAGTLRTENISLTAYANEVESLMNDKQYYILRLHSSDGTFIAGSKNFPAVKQFSGNKQQVDVTFRVVSAEL